MHSRAVRLLASGGTAIMALALSAGAAFADHTPTTIHLQPSQQGTESDCGAGTVTWHFIVNQLDPGTAPLTLFAEFDEDGVLSDVGAPVGNGQTQHFFIDTTGDDTLLDAWVDVGTQTGTPKLVLSHIACGPPPPPSVMVEKDGDELSKIGDQVTYDFKITNTGGWPLTLVSISDDKIGSLITQATTAGCDELAVGEFCEFSVNFVIPVGAADPFVNTVSVEYDHAMGTAANVTDTDSHSTNLFQPAVQIDKTANVTEAKVGDTVTYTFTITNLSSMDSPNLILDSLTDTVLGNLELATNYDADCDTLDYQDTCTFTVDYLIPMGAPSSLTNVVTAHYHPDGFPNDVWDSDDHTITVRGNEGCTPGFWKNHTSAWVGYTTGQTLESIFNVPDNYNLDNKTLIEALSFKGGNTLSGAAQILFRAAVAALLNAANPDVDYTFTEAEIIADVNAALATQDRASILALAAELDAANNQGCPL
jgi:uncharacterized repeat protein (TIGR01451 family)